MQSRRLGLPELKRFSGIIRGGNRRAAKCLEMDAEGWVKVESVLEYLKAESDETWTFAEVIDAFKFDKKQRFALRGPAIPHSKFLEIPVWPYQIRANQGHSQEAVSNNPELATATAVSFFDPRPRPLLDDGEKDQTAARNGKPLEMQDEYPKRLYHRTGRASAMAIVEQGFLVGGGPEVESGKAHNYFSDKPLEDIRYKSGVRASAKFKLVVDTEIAMYFGALFFRTVSDGILTVDRVHPRAVLGIRDTTTDEAVWSAEATELIKLAKDMIVASPESYLCFVNHPLEETIIDDPMENIAEPPAKVAKTASTGAGGKPRAVSSRKDNSGRYPAFP